VCRSCLFSVNCLILLYLCDQDARQLDQELECIDSYDISALTGCVQKIQDEPTELWLACTDTERVPIQSDSIDDAVSLEMKNAPLPPVTNDGLFSRYVETASAKPVQYWLFYKHADNDDEALSGSGIGLAEYSSSVGLSSYIGKVLSQADSCWLIRDDETVIG